MNKKWWGIWIAAIAVTHGLALLAVAEEKAPAAAATAASSADDAVETVETVDEVTPVATASAAGESGVVGASKRLLGRLHPLLVHFPIAWLVLLVLVDLATFVLRRPWQTFGYLLGIGVALSVIPVVATGLLRMASMGATGELFDLLIEHRNLALAASTVVLVAVGLRAVRRNQLAGWARHVYLALILVATALISSAAHHGGMAVYGKDYFSLPGSI
jgi:uncharacterized membrane protein